ncbi:MAG TPA: sigma-70 family RNA polymerase sigma factor [Dermatophilaceae bacterium]|nr:sigma-70 family RNA polymerase sigma factor [Dermatophilaceae bacterium]
MREHHTNELLQLSAETRDETERQRCLDEVVLLNGTIAEAIAARYRARGIESDDLMQVAYLGLVKAAQGYRLGEGPGFLAYAVPTISGEIKRHFRDFGWIVRPPRRVQELRSAVVSTNADLTRVNGRPPTSGELAHALGVDVRDLSEAVLADRCFSAMSLDAPGHSEGSVSLADVLVDETNQFERVDTMMALQPALDGLSERDRRILHLRFIRGWTQEQIGRKIGVSQMQVSRLLNRILGALRTELEGGPVPRSRA